ncbi:MAG: metallophosphoesterase [Clostridiales bacterium]|nr:metallophosphoesterase [Clostridiales bacterium]
MDYFVSDIHGEYDLFVCLLEKIKFSDSDHLIVLGDMIDKGDGSVRVLHELYSMQNATCILGNHEYDFLKYYRSVMRNATIDFDLVLKKLQEYFPNDDGILTWELLDWLDGLKPFLQTDEYIGVHAGVPLDFDGSIKPIENAGIEQLVYDRNFKNANTLVNDKRTVLYGHTPTSYLNETGKIIRYPREGGIGYSRIHVDTGVYLTGILGCYCFDTDQCFYVNK